MKDRRKGETIARATVIATTTILALIAMRRRITIRGSAAEISIVGISRQRLNMGTMPRIQADTTTTTTGIGIGTVTMIAIGIETTIVTATAIGSGIGIGIAIGIETTIATVATGIATGDMAARPN